MSEKMVSLFTRQNEKTLYQLERDGRVINVRRYVELHFGDIAPLFFGQLRLVYKDGGKKSTETGGCQCACLVRDPEGGLPAPYRGNGCIRTFGAGKGSDLFQRP